VDNEFVGYKGNLTSVLTTLVYLPATTERFIQKHIARLPYGQAAQYGSGSSPFDFVSSIYNYWQYTWISRICL
jgi:hypothetical protein